MPIFLIVGALCCSAVAPVRSGQLLATISWSSQMGEGCIGRAELVDAVQARLGREVFVANKEAATLHARIELSIDADGLRADVTLEDASGELAAGARSLRSRDASCHELSEMLVTVMTIMLDLPAPEVERLMAITHAASQERVVDGAWRWSASLSGSGLWGPLPELAWGTTLGVAFDHPPWFRVLTEASIWAPVIKRFDDGRATFFAWRAAVSACRIAGGHGESRVALCGGVRAGTTTAKPTGLDRNTRRQLVACDLTGGLHTALPVLSLFSLRIATTLDVPLRRAAYRYVDNGATRRLFRERPWGLTTNVGIERSWN